ncbi:RDD family protein [Arthrobacter castelli]|uniref:RDD family protein n=1 Tax=Arthrobacter castelli TaxID=271431 RepID=UPI00138AF0E9|nr:RDD family protein [Arthrobacter castelli]
MDELAADRVKAYARDCIGYAAITAGTVPLGIVAHARGWGRRRGFVMAMSAVPPAVATLFATWQEREHGATRGKRHYDLVVLDRSLAPAGYGRLLLRNTVKIGLPWQLGHVVAVGAAFGGFEDRDRLTWSAALVTYPLIGAIMASVLFGKGRALPDRLAGTQVAKSPVQGIRRSLVGSPWRRKSPPGAPA